MSAHHHFGDPCYSCGTPHDEVESGPCKAPLRVMFYCSLGVRRDGVEHYRWTTTDGVEHECHSHVSNHLPYYHFGHSGGDLIQPPHYNSQLERGERKAAQ